MEHRPVLLKEVIEFLNVHESDTVLDATFDGGGHGVAIGNKLGKSGYLIGIEQDENLLKTVKLKVQNLKCKTDLINGNFRDLDTLLEKKLDAVLFDVGMSSLQLEESGGRGFSFQKDEPLIMNYKSQLLPNDLIAKEILNRWPEKEIYRILKEYGEERYALGISRAIVKERKVGRFETTFDLVRVIQRSVPAIYRRARIHPATKTFQALRIAVNDELGALEEGLVKSWGLLKKDGRLVVISFHSLEDRIVKNFFREKKQAGEGIVLTKKPVTASEEEIFCNPRSRSAKLRAILKK